MMRLFLLGLCTLGSIDEGISMGNYTITLNSGPRMPRCSGTGPEQDGTISENPKADLG